jgi:hypothetical protein
VSQKGTIPDSKEHGFVMCHSASSAMGRQPFEITLPLEITLKLMVE